MAGVEGWRVPVQGGDVTDRIYRAVPLTAQEAVFVTDEALGNLCRKCGHIDFAHNRGHRVDGGAWKACRICQNKCDEDPIERYDEYWVRQKREEREKFWGAFGYGAGSLLLVIVVAMIIAVAMS